VIRAALLAVPLCSTLLPTPVGTWTGSYHCGQGETGLSLTVRDAGGDRLTALFHFHPLPANPGVPEGCFRMDGIRNRATGAVEFAPAEWLVRPQGYVGVGLIGWIMPDGTVFQGGVAGPGCSSFTLRRAAQLPPAPPVCRLD
jgi:hypothetical protein